WWWTAAGALSAAAADTFSTEIGTLWSSSARSILTGERVPAGTSGGVSSPGTLAGALGALLIAAAAPAASATAGPGLVAVTALTLAGVAGSIADSLLGATVQHKRWCGTCETFTERETHSCGTRTVHAGGIRWLDNDAVNLMATLTGGAAGALFATLWGAWCARGCAGGWLRPRSPRSLHWWQATDPRARKTRSPGGGETARLRGAPWSSGTPASRASGPAGSSSWTMPAVSPSPGRRGGSHRMAMAGAPSCPATTRRA